MIPSSSNLGPDLWSGSPQPELWTGLRSGSKKFRSEDSEPQFKTGLGHLYTELHVAACVEWFLPLYMSSLSCMHLHQVHGRLPGLNSTWSASAVSMQPLAIWYIIYFVDDQKITHESLLQDDHETPFSVGYTMSPKSVQLLVIHFPCQFSACTKFNGQMHSIIQSNTNPYIHATHTRR